MQPSFDAGYQIGPSYVPIFMTPSGSDNVDHPVPKPKKKPAKKAPARKKK